VHWLRQFRAKSSAPRRFSPRGHDLIVPILSAIAGEDAGAGAWLMPPGNGQVIAGTDFSGSSRAFDANGKLNPVPSYQKFELGADIEYGLADWLTLVAYPSYDSISQPPPAASYDGFGESGVGGRFRLYRTDDFVASAQAVVLTPGGSFDGGPKPSRAGSIDLRAMLGANLPSGRGPPSPTPRAAIGFMRRDSRGSGGSTWPSASGRRPHFCFCCRASARFRR
jgi:hypothetical protein